MGKYAKADMILTDSRYCSNCGRYLKKGKKIKIGNGIYLCESCYEEMNNL